MVYPDFTRFESLDIDFLGRPSRPKDIMKCPDSGSLFLQAGEGSKPIRKVFKTGYREAQHHAAMCMMLARDHAAVTGSK